MTGNLVGGVLLVVLVVTVLAVGSYRGLRRVEIQEERDQALVVAALRAAGRPMFVLDLARQLNVGAGRIYVALARLEAAGEVDSDWVEVGASQVDRRAYWAVPAPAQGGEVR